MVCPGCGVCTAVKQRRRARDACSFEDSSCENERGWDEDANGGGCWPSIVGVCLIDISWPVMDWPVMEWPVM